MFPINFNLYRIALFGNDRKQLPLFYARRGEIAWPNLSHYSLSSKLQSSPNMCHFQMRICMENCAISRREIDEKYLIYSRKYSIPQETRKKSEFYDADFFGCNSKNKLDYIIKNTKGLLLRTALIWCSRHCEIERCKMFGRLPWKQATKNFLRR